MSGRILIVDDDQNLCETIEADLRLRGFTPSWCRSAEAAFAALREHDFDAVLTDMNMPRMNGLELCDRIVSNRPDIPVVVITAFGTMDTAIAAIRAGAYDFVNKPIETDMLALILERAVRHRMLQERVKVLSKELANSQSFEELVGESRAMRVLFENIARVGDADASVLITGESGTGKELVARALHSRSRRSSQAFVAVNCPAIPETLLESELFGHKKGAFTDARETRKGAFVQANGGTLFLDEIGEFPKHLQPKLLRALEERCVRPLGSDEEISCDVRVIAATNRDLDSAVEEERFRRDLFFRINVIQVNVPSLRARGTDTLLLAQHFLEQSAARSGKPVVGLSEAAAGKLLGYRWPGNVRELRNAIEHAVALTQFAKLAVEDLPEKIRNYRSHHVVLGSEDPSELLPMEEVERQYIRHVLEAVGGNRTLASRVLGFDRKTLYRKLQRFEDSGDSPASRHA